MREELYPFSSVGGMWSTIKAMIFNTYANPTAAKKLEKLKKEKDAEKSHPLPVLTETAA